jgi:hypothetical protein
MLVQECSSMLAAPATVDEAREDKDRGTGCAGTFAHR